MAGVLEAARALARLGWPVMPVRPGAKQPLTKNGVKDATTDDVRIGQWWRKWPDANLGVACGTPGPQVLDIDDLTRIEAEELRRLEALGAPEVATPRGRHLYFAGTTRSTIGLGYGELRGVGSYVVCPPSIHPSGKEYIWLVEPNGAELPTAPGGVARDRAGAGAGTHEPVERVPHGQRHTHLKDMAVRLVRSGITDADTIERHLVAEYEAVCDKKPAALPRYFTKIAKWAADSDIAKREIDRKAAQEPEEPKDKKKKRQLPWPPDRDAPLGDLRQYVRIAAGLPDVIRVTEVKRFGPRTLDSLHIYLSNGVRIVFDAQGDVTAPRVWRDTVQAATSGIGKPGTYSGAELGDVLWALCVVSNATAEARFEVDLQELVDDLVAMCESVHGTLEEVEPRYLLLGALKDRPIYDASDRSNAAQPALVVDMRTGKRYLRSSELMSLARHRALGISTAAFEGRMLMISARRRVFQGHGEAGHRKQVLYELPPEGDDE